MQDRIAYLEKTHVSQDLAEVIEDGQRIAQQEQQEHENHLHRMQPSGTIASPLL